MEGRNLNHEVVRVGLPWWHQQYPRTETTPRELEQNARAAKRGLWSDSMPVPPWEWRKAGLVLKFGGEYDLNEMRVGKVIDHSNDACVVPRATLPLKTKVKYALLAAVPAAVVLGAVLTAEKKAAKADDSKADPGAPE